MRDLKKYIIEDIGSITGIDMKLSNCIGMLTEICVLEVHPGKGL